MMRRLPIIGAFALLSVLAGSLKAAPPDAALPPGVKAVWNLEKAYRERTPTRERVCLNGLWRWQPAGAVQETVPETQRPPWQ